MSRYFIHLAFDGANYHGWQRQPGDTSVQETLARALSLLLRREVEITGAGRTDAGVHAAQMYAHFDAVEPLPYSLDVLAEKLNRILPPDVVVYEVMPVPDEMHARFSATARTYHYTVTLRKQPFCRNYAVRLFGAIDFQAMNRAARLLLETEDFTSFSKLHTDAKTNLCHVSVAHWEEIAPGTWRFEIRADRFLRNMVRAVVGTLLEVGRGKITQEEFREIILRKDRCAAGESVPAHGLSLVRIEYSDFIK